jgi:exoribonuclease-2
MFRDNPLLSQLKQDMRQNTPSVEGTVKGTERGFGFLEADDGESYFIAPPQMKKIMHGDRIKAYIQTTGDKTSAEPDSLVEAKLSRFIARIKISKNKLTIVADSPVINMQIRAKLVGLGDQKVNDGDWVVAQLKSHALKEGSFSAEVTGFVATATDPNAPWWVTLARQDLAKDVPAMPDSVEFSDQTNRLDLTDKAFFTIDSASTQDMDDALYVEKTATGSLQVTVAIADPTAYIPADSQLNKIAAERAFTVYLPGRNIPMMPRELSDSVCSLVAGEKRPALCCTYTIDENGALADKFEFFTAWIQSQHKLSYTQVSDWLELPSSNWQPEVQLAEQLQSLALFAKSRQQWRKKNAIVFPDQPDYSFELDNSGNVLAIHVEHRRIANQMIEETMVAANIIAARLFRQNDNLGVFNTHAGFDPEKIDNVIALLAEHDIDCTKEHIQSLPGYVELQRTLAEKANPALDSRLRRMQSYSLISASAERHFAMGLEGYATWTSPIRKYSDIINHRLIKATLTNTTAPSATEDEVNLMSERRRQHRMAERDIASWLYVDFLTPAVESKQEFQASIMDVNRGGLRVRLIENGATAFIPASMLHGNKKEVKCLTDTGQITIKDQVEYSLGDVIAINIAEINQEKRNIVAKPVQLTK